MSDIVYSPLFGFLLTLGSYEIGTAVSRRISSPLANPLLISMVIIIGILRLFGISFDAFNVGGDILAIFIAPATTMLAITVYNQRLMLKTYLVPILVGCTVGSSVSIGSVFILSKIFGLDTVLTDSLIPKSVTNAIAIELSAQVGGIPSLTIMSVLITGISGVILAPVLIRIAKIQNPVAQGIAFGTSTHLIGTAKALEYGELQGAMSSIAVFITGVITVIVAAFLS
jgi:putative effector of murein hydrolase